MIMDDAPERWNQLKPYQRAWLSCQSENDLEQIDRMKQTFHRYETAAWLIRWVVLLIFGGLTAMVAFEETIGKAFNFMKGLVK